MTERSNEQVAEQLKNRADKVDTKEGPDARAGFDLTDHMRQIYNTLGEVIEAAGDGDKPKARAYMIHVGGDALIALRYLIPREKLLN